jgi:hypothetical protein
MAHPKPIDRLLPYAEWIAILGLIALYFLSFRLESRINGYVIPEHVPVSESVLEVFHQDTHFIIQALDKETRYSVQEPHHLLVHVATDAVYNTLKPFLHHGIRTVYRFLKIFTVIQAALFLFMMRIFLMQFGLSPLRRLALLLLTGCAVSVWFHYAAFETHAMAMPALVGYLLLMQRIVREERPPPRTYILLGICLVFMALVRLDNFRFILLTLPVLLFRGAREKWKPLGLTVALSLLVAIALYVPLTSHYLKIPVRDVAKNVLYRRDRPGLRRQMKTIRNLTPDKLGQMTAAMTVYSFVMPRGVDNFATPFADQFKHPGSAAACGFFALGLAAALGRLLRRRSWRNPFVLLLALNGTAALFFYTWFNPLEPFLWTLEFVPLIIAGVALSLAVPAPPEASPGQGREPFITAFLVLTLLLMIVNNVLFFLLPYRQPWL